MADLIVFPDVGGFGLAVLAEAGLDAGFAFFDLHDVFVIFAEVKPAGGALGAVVQLFDLHVSVGIKPLGAVGSVGGLKGRRDRTVIFNGLLPSIWHDFGIVLTTCFQSLSKLRIDFFQGRGFGRMILVFGRRGGDRRSHGRVR